MKTLKKAHTSSRRLCFFLVSEAALIGADSVDMFANVVDCERCGEGETARSGNGTESFGCVTVGIGIHDIHVFDFFCRRDRR